MAENDEDEVYTDEDFFNDCINMQAAKQREEKINEAKYIWLDYNREYDKWRTDASFNQE